MKPVILWTVLLVIALGLGWGLAALIPEPSAPNGPDDRQTASPAVLPAPTSIGGDFTLTDQTGQPFSTADLTGKLRLLYFGFVSCPDICPTDLADIAGALALLGDEADQVVPIFVSVDPERDTPDVLADHLALFDDRLIGLTGDPDAIRAAAKDWMVYYQKVPTEDPDFWLIDHSTFTYLVGRDGTPISIIRHDAGPAEIAEAVRAALG